MLHEVWREPTAGRPLPQPVQPRTQHAVVWVGPAGDLGMFDFYNRSVSTVSGGSELAAVARVRSGRLCSPRDLEEYLSLRILKPDHAAFAPSMLNQGLPILCSSWSGLVGSVECREQMRTPGFDPLILIVGGDEGSSQRPDGTVMQQFHCTLTLPDDRRGLLDGELVHNPEQQY